MILPLLSIPVAVTMAPRIEIYNLLACSVHRPEIFDLSLVGSASNAAQGHHNVYSQLTFNNTTATTYHTQFVPQILLDRRRSPVDAISLFSSDSESPQSRCASDPVVRAAVAKLTAGEPSICSLPFYLSECICPSSNHGRFWYHDVHYDGLVGIGKFFSITRILDLLQCPVSSLIDMVAS